MISSIFRFFEDTSRSQNQSQLDEEGTFELCVYLFRLISDMTGPILTGLLIKGNLEYFI